jgi:hypothetical protein
MEMGAESSLVYLTTLFKTQCISSSADLILNPELQRDVHYFFLLNPQ